MGALILPARFTQQPQQPAPVDKSLGITDLWLGSLPGKTLVRGESTVEKFSGSVGSPNPKSVSVAGRGVYGDGSTNFSGMQIAASSETVLSGDVTIFMVRRCRDTINRGYLAAGYDAGANDRAILAIPEAGTGQIIFDYGNATEGSGRLLGPVYVKDTQVETLVFIAGQKKGREIWRRGVKLAGNPSAKATRSATGLPFSIGPSNNATAFDNVEYVMFGFASREWSDAEIVAWSADPWGRTFKAPPRRLWVAPGAADSSLVGAAAAQATASGSLSASIRLTAGAAAVASATGALSTAVRMAGAAVAQASAAGALSTAIQLSGTASASAIATGTLAGGAAALSGSAIATATAAGALATAVTLTGAGVAQATASGVLATQIKLTGAASAGASAAGALSTGIALSGAAQAIASASGTLAGGAAQLSGAAVASASAGGSLTTGIRLSGAATAQASASGALAGTGAVLSGAAVASASASGALLTTIRMTGLAAASASASGTLGTAGAQLSGAAVAQASANGALWTSIRLAGAALAQASAAGSLTAPGRDNFARAPDGTGYSPQRIESQARPGSASTARPANTQRNYR
jgi:hypothetical protein